MREAVYQIDIRAIWTWFTLCAAALFLGGCLSSSPDKPTTTMVAQTDISSVMTVRSVRFDENSVIPDTPQQQTLAMNMEAEKDKGCSFSSMQRKTTLGYEIDPTRHITFKASPSFDVWSMDDFKMKASLRFTKSIGGPALKRPCTFGSGYYGLVPYFGNNTDSLSVITNPSMIKSMIRDKVDERQARDL